MNIINLPATDSTNSWLAANCAELPDMTLVAADSQSAGRGQRGNTWESTPAMNLTFSVLHRPQTFRASLQFALSEATALAIVEALSGFGIDAAVKWPNDVYCGDRKICGILIEHSVLGMDIRHSIIGVGLNVNQTRWLGDAPNPVGMAGLAGHEFDRGEVLRAVADALERNLRRAATEEGRGLLHQEYLHNLWRGDGLFHPFRDRATAELFDARICDVESSGMLLLETRDGAPRRYAFKEVEFLLPAQPGADAPR